MADVPPANPMTPPFNIVLPTNQQLGILVGNDRNGPSLYQFGLAIVVLYFVMRYVPNGINIGLIVLALVFISTPDAVKSFANGLTAIERGFQP